MRMAYADTLPPQRKFGQTLRPDAWWVQPLFIFLGFAAFIVYSTWAAFHPTTATGNCAYWFNGGGADYLSPFFSPEIWGNSPHAIFHGTPSFWPGWLPFSPALLILWAPGGFRFTCYYYRGAYYKAFWADPINCAVGEPRKKYLGERYFPLIIQNIHRYFMYVALVFILLLAYDAFEAMWFTDALTGKAHFGIGVGTLIMVVNVFLLSSYTLGCHSLRHLVGGFLDSKSKAPSCAKTYNCVSCLNKSHMMWAWFSLFSVGFTDLYIRLCSMGIWHDWRIF
jgi:hypothetical protein